MTSERVRTISDMIMAALFVALSLVGHAALSSLDTKARLGIQSSGAPLIQFQDARVPPAPPATAQPDQS